MLLQHEYKLMHMLITAVYVHDIHAHTQTCTTHDSQTCVVLEYTLEEKAYHVQHTLNSLALSRLLARWRNNLVQVCQRQIQSLKELIHTHTHHVRIWR